MAVSRVDLRAANWAATTVEPLAETMVPTWAEMTVALTVES